MLIYVKCLTVKVKGSIIRSVKRCFPRCLKYVSECGLSRCLHAPRKHSRAIQKDNRNSPHPPEQYGRKQLGLQSSFFMNRICPLSFRQKKFLSPRTKTEDADWFKGMIQISRACSPIFRVQSTCKAKAKSDAAVKTDVPTMSNQEGTG